MSYKKLRLTVEPLSFDHFSEVDAIDLQKEDVGFMKDVFEKSGMPEHQGCARDRQGNIVLLFGLYQISHKVYEVWTIFTKHWKPIFYPSSRAWIDRYLGLLDYVRVQHIIYADRPWTCKIIEYMGFERETLVPLKKMINGKDCHIYARFK